MTRRYFVPDLPITGGLISLPDAEAQHAVRVMRVQVGDEVELFDGKGHQSQGIITAIKRNQCECEAAASSSISREPSTRVDLGIALPKPDRAKELIERLTELGVHSVTPLLAQRSQRPPSASLLEKLSRAVVEACKQCGRNHLMEIRSTQSADEFFRDSDGGNKLIAHPSAESVRLASIQRDQPCIAAVGPEGGWTDEEVESARSHGFRPLSLGSRIYRIETAAVAIACVIAAE